MRSHPHRNDGSARRCAPEGRESARARMFLPSAAAPSSCRAAHGPGRDARRRHPLVLNTGRFQHHWHTLTKTGRSRRSTSSPRPLRRAAPRGRHDARYRRPGSDRGASRAAGARCYPPSSPIGFGRAISSRRFPLERRVGEALAINAVTREVVAGKQLIDLLRAFPVRASATEWLDVLKRLQPRQYSISSSPKVHPDEVQLTVLGGALRPRRRPTPRRVRASTAIARRAPRCRLTFSARRTFARQHSRRRRSWLDPAPFGILAEPQAAGAKGRNSFFGEQRANFDFYYRDEFDVLRQHGICTGSTRRSRAIRPTRSTCSTVS